MHGQATNLSCRHRLDSQALRYHEGVFGRLASNLVLVLLVVVYAELLETSSSKIPLKFPTSSGVNASRSSARNALLTASASSRSAISSGVTHAQIETRSSPAIASSPSSHARSTIVL